jgi:hypothetical protein
MPFQKKPAGTQRTLTMTIRFRPQVRDVINKKMEQMRSLAGWEEMTHSELVRIAVWEYCKDANDPREP